jgi:hypothetical protein
VPLVSKAYLFKKLSLKMENFFEAPHVLLSAHTMKSPVLPVLKVEVGRVLGCAESQQHALEQ